MMPQLLVKRLLSKGEFTVVIGPRVPGESVAPMFQMN